MSSSLRRATVIVILLGVFFVPGLLQAEDSGPGLGACEPAGC